MVGALVVVVVVVVGVVVVVLIIDRNVEVIKFNITETYTWGAKN